MTSEMPNGTFSSKDHSERPTAALPPALPPGRLTASRLELARRCPGSFAIGHAQDDSAPAAAGTEIHAFIEELLKSGQLDPGLVEDPAAREVCEKIDPVDLLETARGEGYIMDDLLDIADFERPPRILVEHKMALAPDAKSALVLDGETEHRDYSEAPEDYICGTVDVVALYDGAEAREKAGAAVITDWKTGRNVTAPERNLQLRFQAVATALAYGVEVVIVQIAYVFHDGTVHPSSFTFTRTDLDGAAEELRRILRRVQEAREGREEFRTGSHCGNCPAFASCPAQAGAAQALLDADTEELTPAKAAEIWPRLQAVEAATKKVRKALGAYVGRNPEGVPLEDPDDPHSRKVLRYQTTARDTILPDVAMPILRREYGEEADRAVTITKKGLQNVAGPEYKEIFTRIEEEEGVRTSYSESLKECGG